RGARGDSRAGTHKLSNGQPSRRICAFDSTTVERPSRKLMSSLPFVSVVMPVRNEGDFIRRSLGAVLAQNYPSYRMEVIVVDGCSTDGTVDAVNEIARQYTNVILLDNPREIVATALNRALAVARGEIIVRVDGHTIINSDYVRECVRALEKSQADN